MGARRQDVPRKLHDVGAGRAPGLGGLARGVDLDVDVDGLGVALAVGVALRGRRAHQEIAPGPVEQVGLLGRVEARDGKEVRDLGQRLAVLGLQAADKVPLDRGRQEGGLAGEFLGVVFAKVDLRRDALDGGGLVRRLVQGENVIGRLELGDCYQADLHVGKDRIRVRSFDIYIYTYIKRESAYWSSLGNGRNPLLDLLQLEDERLGSGRVYLHLCLAHTWAEMSTQSKSLAAEE